LVKEQEQGYTMDHIASPSGSNSVEYELESEEMKKESEIELKGYAVKGSQAMEVDGEEQEFDFLDDEEHSGAEGAEDEEDFVGLVDQDELQLKNSGRRGSKLANLVKDKMPKILKQVSQKAKRSSKLSKSKKKEISKQSVEEFGDKDTPLRIKKLIKEATLGDIEAQFSLGYCYDLGTYNVESNTDMAIHWYSEAALAGHAIAQNNLGVLYATGHRGKVDKQAAEALAWFKHGAEAGNRNAAFHCGLAYLNGDGIEERDDEEAFRYFKIAGKLGHGLSQSNVGAMYMSGRGCVKNYKKAMKWCKKAAKSGEGDAVSIHNLGVMYEQGYGTDVDHEKAEMYFKLSMSGHNVNVISEKLSERTRQRGLTLYNS